MSDRLWFVTGAGRGLGHAFVEAALQHGDRVVATARRPDALSRLQTQYGNRLFVEQLDVRNAAVVDEVAARIIADLGTPDIVVNNAGYGAVGAIEELSEESFIDQLDVNLVGVLRVTKAFLPAMRERRSGHIVQVSSVGAVGHMPFFGAYNASKWALEGMSAALADEVRSSGVQVHLLQLGGFQTDWAGSSMHFAKENGAYAGLREAVFGSDSYPCGDGDGDAESTDDDPVLAARALLGLLEDPDPPLRTIIGTGAHEMVNLALGDRRDDYAKDPAFRWPERSAGASTKP